MNCHKALDEHRPLLFSIAYRMLGSVMDAEDMLQEAFLRCEQGNSENVHSEKAFLTSIVTRLCIDHLRKASTQRESYYGEWLPEPIITDDSPEEMTMMAESLSFAFLLMLERMSALERAVFLLHEVFSYAYDEIAVIVGKTEANCRQILRRARRHVTTDRPRFDVDRAQHVAIIHQFMQTCWAGDVEQLVAMLSENTVFISDGGGKASAALYPLRDRHKIAQFCIGITQRLPPTVQTKLIDMNGLPAVVIYEAGKVINVSLAYIRNGKIFAMYSIRNPDKLQHIPPQDV